MDLMKTLLSSVPSIAKDSKASDKDVKSVLTSALPYLMSGKGTTAEQNNALAKETGIDAKSVSSIVSSALPYVKDALKKVDTDKVSSVISKVATEDNLKKAADLAGSFFKKK